MKAAVVTKLDQIEIQEVEKPAIDSNGVLLRVKACAICGSDIRILHAGNNRVQFPAIIGHEISGEVVEAGENVTKFKVGDRVAVGADVPCGECTFCEAGIGNNCQINYAMGYQFQGGFAEYLPLNRIVVNYGPVHKIPDNLTYEEAAMAEPLGCVLNALELSPVKLGDNVVIIGAGPIGCMMANVVKRMGAAKVILIQRSKHRLEMAKKVVNADVFICSNEENAIERVLAETSGLGADVIFTANPSPEAQQDAIFMAKNRAYVNFFGGLPKNKENVLLNTNVIHYKELLITGAHGAMPIHHQQAIDLIASGTIDVKPFMTECFPLDEISKAFERAESHDGMRIIVQP
ncbi:MAG: alcohol dehydrogenase catalytic domain-containing protein [Vallitaleaceae bacterium]|nr:alcohol dehydrogenase catalytic domain-containing protein [Vallitaleaceae bacterium]